MQLVAVVGELGNVHHISIIACCSGCLVICHGRWGSGRLRLASELGAIQKIAVFGIWGLGCSRHFSGRFELFGGLE